MIIDAHLHLDDQLYKSADEAAYDLSNQLEEAGIDQGIVLHLESQPWSLEDFSKATSKYTNLKSFVNINPNKANADQILKRSVQEFGYIGLKLHPRLQKINVNDLSTIRLVNFAGELGIPVLIDAFPDGTSLMQGFSPLHYAYLAKECQNTKIIWAHMGGHYVIDFMMLAKRLPNVYMDCSYSLLYYRSSSVTKDMIYAMRSMKFDRIFYGSDYPDRSIALSLEMSIDCLKENDIGESEMAKLMGENAKIFFDGIINVLNK
jgi:predicted TIM-barrel fold metal-dependent hydrolase